jgi:fatty acid desaturase
LLIFVNKDLGTGWAIFLAAFLGIILSGIGFSVMHDANHGSYCSMKWRTKTLKASHDKCENG